MFDFQPAFANRNQAIFLVATGAGLASAYFASGDDATGKKDFFNLQGEFYSGIRETSVTSQGFAIERRVADWFSAGLEITVQEMFAPDYGSFGVSFNPQFKWFIFGKSNFSPYIAYTSGLFMASQEFPQGGTNFTFRLIYALGVEYKLNPEQRVRLSLGHLHQSNNNLFDRNPGYDGNGVAVAYVWMW